MVIAYSMNFRQLFDARHGVKKTMPDMASGFPSTDYSVPCLAPFFNAMSGVKKLTEVHAISDYHTLTCHPSHTNQSMNLIHNHGSDRPD